MEQQEQLNHLGERIEAVFAEVRRQGRAGVAAQAAAEACLMMIQQSSAETVGKPQRPGPEERTSETAPLAQHITMLLPVFDAIDGSVSLSRRMAHSERSPRGWRERLLRLGNSDNEEVSSLARGVSLVQSELRSALGRLGVVVDAEVGVPVDPTRHRVTEVRSTGRADSRSAAPVVLEVLRPAYLVDGTCIRDADVVASAQAASGPAVSETTP